MQQAEDTEYLYFGIWSSIPDNINGMGYDFEYIAGGEAEPRANLANFNLLTGSATFRGGAVGKYVTQGQVGGQNAKIGTFTATATLKADFGTASEAGTLSGSITDFHEDGSPLAGWRVTLGSTDDVGEVATIPGTAGDEITGSTVANIGGLSVGGTWGADFYGSNNNNLDHDPTATPNPRNLTTYPLARYPLIDLAGVAGWFDAVGPGDGDRPNDVALPEPLPPPPSN